MALEDKGAQHDKVPVDKYHDPNANYQMTTRDYVLRPSADPVSGAIVITLPRVAEAKGRFYSIIARVADGGNTITIQDYGNDSECWQGDIVLDGPCDRALMYSDGLAWHPLVAGGGPGGWPGFDTTAAPGTTAAPTTAAPTSETPTTEPGGATSAAPTTVAPTSAAPTTVAPTTV